jgi:prolipoprotein diacylglyceryl transferase
VSLFMDAVAPALLVAQAIGRVGNYFNKELFGKPTGLPWGLEIPLAYRPPGYTAYRYFQPSFLYELIFDLLLAAALVWLGHHRNIKPPGLFALYVAGYSAYRIFEETIRIDSSAHFLGLRLNMYIAIALTVIGAVWFVRSQRPGRRTAANAPPGAEPAVAAPPGASGSSGPAAESAGTAQDAAEVAGTDHAPAQGERRADRTRPA